MEEHLSMKVYGDFNVKKRNNRSKSKVVKKSMDMEVFGYERFALMKDLL